jgi:hypothetical protein
MTPKNGRWPFAQCFASQNARHRCHQNQLAAISSQQTVLLIEASIFIAPALTR